MDATWRQTANSRRSRGRIVDLDMCWAFNLADPWGNPYELGCYPYEHIKAELIEAHGVEPTRSQKTYTAPAYVALLLAWLPSTPVALEASFQAPMARTEPSAESATVLPKPS